MAAIRILKPEYFYLSPGLSYRKLVGGGRCCVALKGTKNLYTKICISSIFKVTVENSDMLELYKFHNSLAPSLCCFGRRIGVPNDRISKTRLCRHRSVLCGQTLKRTIAIVIAIAASCTFAYNFYLLKQILAVQFVLQYIGSKIIPKITAHSWKFYLKTLHTSLRRRERHANFRFNRYSGASPQIGEIFLCLFRPSCPSNLFFSILRPGRTAGPIFMLHSSNDVFPCKDGPFGG